MPHSYITDGAEIYRQSFATIRAEAALSRFTPEEEIVAVRMIDGVVVMIIAAGVGKRTAGIVMVGGRAAGVGDGDGIGKRKGKEEAEGEAEAEEGVEAQAGAVITGTLRGEITATSCRARV